MALLRDYNVAYNVILTGMLDHTKYSNLIKNLTQNDLMELRQPTNLRLPQTCIDT